MKKKDSIKENNWYKDEQFIRQLQNPEQKMVVMKRWEIFKKEIELRYKNTDRSLKVLDAGCGDGINLVFLSNTLKEISSDYELVGIDLSELRVDRAKKTNIATVIQGSITKMSFPDSHFDIILCNHVIEHIPNPSAAVSEIKRILKPQGMAIIGVPNEGCLMAQLRNNIFQRSILQTTDHINFFTSNSLNELLNINELEVNKIHKEGFFFPHTFITRLVRRYVFGKYFIDYLSKIFNSQSADLIAITQKGAEIESTGFDPRA